MTLFYILLKNIRECALFKKHVYHASKQLRGKELERGTILLEDPNDKTRFVVADRKEVFFDKSCVEGLDDKSELLSDELAEVLLEIISLDERLRLFRQRVRESSRRVTYSEAELLRPRTPTEGADGRPRSRRSESRSAARRDEERQKLENELTLQREQIDNLTARKEDLEKQLYEKECRSVRQDEERKKLEKELELQKGRTNTLVEKNEALKKQLSEKDTHLAAFDQQRRKLEEEKVRLMKTQKVFQKKLNEVTQSRSEQKDQLTKRLNDLQENLDEVRESGNEERYQLMERLKDLQEDLDEVTQAREVAEQQVRNLEAESIAKDEHMKELEESLSTIQQALDGRPKESCEWVISRDEIFLTDKILGEGAWGKVLLGRFRNCKVAVKQVHSLIRFPSARSSFEREMEVASRCRHPCLLQFIGATNDEGTPLLVTELMETSLRASLGPQFQPLSVPGIYIISLDVALGLNYLHQTKPLPIIHRDLSSANVLLWRHGRRWRGKVSDYGSANFIQQRMTPGPGARVYSAPEAATEDKQTIKIDVYSFGVLLCEMCTRKFPDPDRREEQISQVKNEEFRSLIQRCVQPDPGERPDMQEISFELEALFDPQSEMEDDKPSIGEIEQMLRSAVIETKDEDQSKEIRQETNELHTTSSIQPRREIPDWIIPREQIELTGDWLGKGSLGLVFRGKYNGFAVAVKQIHETLLSLDSRSLYEQTIDVASRCRHPCLLQFIGATRDEGFPLIVTELMERSLESFLASRSLSEKEISFISQDVAAALNYLHHKLPSPIVHRNVSSANVLLWLQGPQWRGKLTISIATTFQQETMSTAPGDMLYSAPETVSSRQTVKMDIYSFGVLLCQMCILESPDRERREEQVKMVTNQALQEMIKRCLKRDPEDRPRIEDIVNMLGMG
ncbi:probable serine/threonine-protein kinase DDB_G0271682 [Stylophora pistillata]|uniref:probable serine/threonine-protein kinase DDB_G0271682 n=1 Tax=Stylophora pistillata TaxID=50429 RepID=UPI000C0514DD|nr:probable serine/threonine-protein kinase DDB_G0271682 [Stylophora pistillata]